MQNSEQTRQEEIITCCNTGITKRQRIPERFEMKETPHPSRNGAKILTSEALL
jgi:hypothetical protein